MEAKDIERLAHLARIRLGDDLKNRLSRELEEVLMYVERVTEIVGERALETTSPVHRNVLREDQESHEGGVYTDALLDAAPHRSGRHIAVKKIIDNG